ncbi:hypothetical protein C8034_v000170 [Colletotrichum sidae]|uniref:Uncharacterized protein n=3 Tax=Colletotrichum orbiculare species complex TaxID=2707354 RepID=N4VJL4_COLOR|nr:hypothetical protein Cob_v002294 [Colletotrichum orbiculare MAFF 240422]TDZ39421.1 hypothetical protein C8035_v003377 [Colletotrichum spinosum]TEA20328.1 hypothetical protein C8034_v000170 [Colletotrichum sidae]
MCNQWIAAATCTRAVNNEPRAGCKGTHVVVVRRVVCERARQRCICFFGSCGELLTLSEADRHATVRAPCEACGADEDPEQMLLLRVFDDAFAREWNAAFGDLHWDKCTLGKWRGRWDEDCSEGREQ